MFNKVGAECVMAANCTILEPGSSAAMPSNSLSLFVKTDLPQLVELAYDAALDEPRWQEFIDVFSRTFDGAAAMMYCLDRHRAGAAAEAVFSRNRELRLTATDAENYLGLNSEASDASPAVMVGNVSLAAQPENLAHRLQQSVPLPPAYLRIPLCSSGRRTVMLALAPDARQLIERQRYYLRRLEMLAPHFVRAVKLSFVTERERPLPLSRSNLLESFRVCAFVVDAQERIVTMNRLAEAFLNSKETLTLDRFRKLSAILPEQTKLLRKTLASARTSSPAGVAVPLKLTSDRPGGGCLIWIIPLNSGIHIDNLSDAQNRMRLLGVERAGGSFLLLVCKLSDTTEASQKILMANFGLSKTEARLSATLATGRSLADYAKESGVSRNTARNQLSIVFEKTGVRRQAELVARIARICETSSG